MATKFDGFKYDETLSRAFALPDGSPPHTGCEFNNDGTIKTINWKVGVTPIPLEQIDAAWIPILAQLIKEQKMGRLFKENNGAAVFQAVDLLLSALEDIRDNINNQQPLNSTIDNKLEILRNRINNIKNS